MEYNGIQNYNHVKKLIPLLLIILISISSCKKEDDLMLSDDFRVRHAGADMPVYVHGNGKEKIFVVFIQRLPS